jgi:hypothetical protein
MVVLGIEHILDFLFVMSNNQLEVAIRLGNANQNLRRRPRYQAFESVVVNRSNGYVVSSLNRTWDGVIR